MDKSAKYVLEYWWKKIRKSDIPNLFTGFQDFANWSMRNGYKYGRRLRIIDKGGEYSPDNMEWVDVDVDSKYSELVKQKAIAKWNRFIEPIRERYQEELDRLEEIEKQERTQKEQPAREFFQYEHPDLVREGICFISET